MLGRAPGRLQNFASFSPGKIAGKCASSRFLRRRCFVQSPKVFGAVLALLTFCSIFDEFCRIWSAVPIVFERVGFWVLFFSGVGRRAALCRTVVFFCRSLVQYIVFCSSCRFDRLLGVHFQIWWASGCLSAGEFMGVHSNFPLSCCMGPISSGVHGVAGWRGTGGVLSFV